MLLVGSSKLSLLVILVGTGSSKRFSLLPKLDRTGLDGAYLASVGRLPVSGSSSSKLGRERTLDRLRK